MELALEDVGFGVPFMFDNVLYIRVNMYGGSYRFKDLPNESVWTISLESGALTEFQDRYEVVVIPKATVVVE